MHRNPDDSHEVVDAVAVPRVIARSEAYALGFSRRAIEHRLNTGRWRLVLPHTLLTCDTLTWPDRMTAALAFAGRQALLTGAGALADLGLRAVRRPERLDVLVPWECGARSVAWVRVRRTRRLPAPALLPGPHRAPMARAVADLAVAASSPDHVRAVVAQAVRASLCTVDELQQELAAGPRNGSAHLRAALREVDAGAWSAPEARAARTLRSAGISGFEQNAPVRLPGGRLVIADFLWRGLRAVLEIDSVEFHLDPRDWRATMDRHLALAAAGYSVVHRTPSDVANPLRFARDVREWLRSCAAAS